MTRPSGTVRCGCSYTCDEVKAAKRRISCLRNALDLVRSLVCSQQEIDAVDIIDAVLKADRKAARGNR